MVLVKWESLISLNYQTKNNTKRKETLNGHAKCSGIAFKMGVIIFIGIFGIYNIDEYFVFEKYPLTIILSLLYVILAIYIIKDLLK